MLPDAVHRTGPCHHTDRVLYHVDNIAYMQHSAPWLLSCGVGRTGHCDRTPCTPCCHHVFGNLRDGVHVSLTSIDCRVNKDQKQEYNPRKAPWKSSGQIARNMDMSGAPLPRSTSQPIATSVYRHAVERNAILFASATSHQTSLITYTFYSQPVFTIFCTRTEHGTHAPA